MKRCPACSRAETDDALAFCRVDGTALVSDSGLISDARTATFDSAAVSGEIETSILPHAKSPEANRAAPPTTALPAQQSPDITRELSKLRRSGPLFAMAGLVLIMIATAGYFYLSRKSNAAIQSIAVMPFLNESGSADVEYLSDGMTETLINSLSTLPNLRVKARSTVFRYKGKELDPKKLASELNVQAVLTGRVLQRNDLLTLSLELIDAQTENVIWGNKYERKSSDLIELQSEIARDVSSKLKSKLSGPDETKVTKTYTENPEAYRLYLKGRFYFAKRTKEDVLHSIESYKEAIGLDPSFALAYVGVADSYGIMTAFGYAAPNDVIPQAKMAAQRALQIDPELAEAHAAYAKLISDYDWNRLESEGEYKRAIELNPNVALTHYQYGFSCLVPLGRFDEGINELKKALELEPLSVAAAGCLAGAYSFARRNDLAVQAGREAIALEPNHPTARIWLAFAYDTGAMYSDAISLCQNTLRSDPDNQDCLQIVGYAYAKMGRRREAEEVIKKFENLGRTRYSVAYRAAVIHALLGDKDQAFAGLEKSFAAHDWDIGYMKVDPFVDSLRGDPRFKDLVKRMGLPE